METTRPKQRPSKPENKFKEPANATKGMSVAKRYVPNRALKKKNGYSLGIKSPATNKRGRSKFFLRKAKDAGKSKKKEGSQENAVEKNTKRGTVPYL